MFDTHVSLAHGNGGRRMRELIATVFARQLHNPLLDTQADAALVSLPVGGDMVMTTDSFTVQPLEFPGGNIGSLAVHGTVNDLAVAGADPCYLTVAALIEEGLERSLLERLVASMAVAAREAGAVVVAGDTKVLPRGSGGGIYFSLAGVGIRPTGVVLGMDRIVPGDLLLVSGPVGDHGTAVLLAREAFGLKGKLCSDAASVLPLTRPVRTLSGLRFMRDPTRGGLATVAHELAQGTGLAVRLQEQAIPVQEVVRGVCDMLGYDPLYLACEGRVLAVVASDQAEEVLHRWRTAGATAAACIGSMQAGSPRVILETRLGGERLLMELEEEPLPRIC